MGKNVTIPAGVRDTKITLQQALLFSLLLDNWVKGKGGIVAIDDIAASGNMTREQVRLEAVALHYKGMLDIDSADFIPRGYRVASVKINVEPCIKAVDEDDDGQEEIDFDAEDQAVRHCSRYQSGFETFKIGDAEFEALVNPNSDGSGNWILTITRTADGAILVCINATSKEDAWQWCDEWAKGDGPKAEAKPKINVLEWLAFQRKEGILTNDQELRFAPRSFWAVVDALGIERKLLEAEPFPMVENVLEAYDVPFTVVLGDKETGFVIEGYEEVEEASLFDQPVEEPKAEPAEETKAEFTVIVSLDGVETEVVVHHEPNFLKEDEPMDKFVFTVTDVEYERLIASERVPFGQAIHEFARDLAQKAIDEAESA